MTWPEIRTLIERVVRDAEANAARLLRPKRSGWSVARLRPRPVELVGRDRQIDHDLMVFGLRSFSLLVVRMLLVVRPGAPSSFLLPVVGRLRS